MDSVVQRPTKIFMQFGKLRVKRLSWLNILYYGLLLRFIFLSVLGFEQAPSCELTIATWTALKLRFIANINVSGPLRYYKKKPIRNSGPEVFIKAYTFACLWWFVILLYDRYANLVQKWIYVRFRHFECNIIIMRL